MCQICSDKRKTFKCIDKNEIGEQTFKCISFDEAVETETGPAAVP